MAKMGTSHSTSFTKPHDGSIAKLGFAAIENVFWLFEEGKHAGRNMIRSPC
jgi:hypothetical protein